jgi:mono/diheme cytochrome c family protein
MRFTGSIFLICQLTIAGAQSVAAEDIVDFNRDIRPILSNQCFACHGPDAKERKGGTDGYRLDNEQGAFADLGGYATIVRGKPEESELIRRITSGDKDERMPPVDSGKKLTARDIQLLTQWVKQGAPYAKHWAYVKPVRPALPDITQTNKALPSWPRNEIDHFILARLLREGLVPSPEADRYALVRRVSLDLTGLPPTLDEVDQFASDTSADAYEKLVDRLLEKKSYGEHWARTWLDLARYADSAGYADDPARTIWAYRDYVIDSLNANKPFDQFTIEQIAGDLLPSPTEEQLTATAFNRNTLTNNEGGTNDEEFRNVAVVDRVNTTMAVWMGTTMMCAQCHDHKYDPLSQEEYFRLFAIFNNTDDADRRDESPLLSFFTEEQQKQKAQLEAEIAELERAQKPDAADAQAAKDRLAALKKQLSELKPHTTVPVMRELPDGKRRKTQIQLRGNFLDLGREVTEGLPRVFHSLPDETTVNRLALAKWLVDENNPLTARVIVNRYWEQIFGVGIVRTSEEFGTQGELPLHPELLDWLATELVQQHWDMKHVLKLLVTSAAYRQSSRVTPQLMELDPDNRLLARGPRFRLSAEMIRDQALAVSGLLSAKLHGPPVKPPQPSLGISAAFGSGIDWQASEGEDRYRRGLYTTWRRSNPYPSMATFDAPNREVCTLHRDRTNTPLQALVTLNDPVYVEAAQALARRMTAAGSSPSDRASYGFRLCLARHPTPDELDRLVRLYEQARERFANEADKAKRIATVPLGAAPPDSDITDLAAWTVVSNVLLNLDEMMMKR